MYLVRGESMHFYQLKPHFDVVYTFCTVQEHRLYI